ncbi:MAG TPA: hypothetical protein VGG74_09435 [Kofleriaceae bacterium]|jgi:hypothetical protein
MRRSTVVTLTILPVLAAAAVARADNPPPAPPVVPSSALPPDAWSGQEPSLQPPGMTEQVLMPPGMTPPIDCEDDPNWDERPECQPSYGYYVFDGRVIRGGFGHYFWVAGG